MSQSADLASRLLRLEQQLNAYQRLHEDELAELWRALNECKRAITELVAEYATGPVPARVEDEAPEPQRQEQGVVPGN